VCHAEREVRRTPDAHTSMNLRRTDSTFPGQYSIATTLYLARACNAAASTHETTPSLTARLTCKLIRDSCFQTGKLTAYHVWHLVAHLRSEENVRYPLPHGEMNYRLFVPKTFRSQERKFPRTKGPDNESSRNGSSRERSLENQSSPYGLFVLGNERS